MLRTAGTLRRTLTWLSFLWETFVWGARPCVPSTAARASARSLSSSSALLSKFPPAAGAALAPGSANASQDVTGQDCELHCTAKLTVLHPANVQQLPQAAYEVGKLLMCSVPFVSATPPYRGQVHPCPSPTPGRSINRCLPVGRLGEVPGAGAAAGCCCGPPTAPPSLGAPVEERRLAALPAAPAAAAPAAVAPAPPSGPWPPLSPRGRQSQRRDAGATAHVHPVGLPI